MAAKSPATTAEASARTIHPDAVSLGGHSSSRAPALTEYEKCRSCGEKGELLWCDGCPNSYHLACLSPPLERAPESDWFCTECVGFGPNNALFCIYYSQTMLMSRSASRFHTLSLNAERLSGFLLALISAGLQRQVYLFVYSFYTTKGLIVFFFSLQVLERQTSRTLVQTFGDHQR